MKLIPVDRSRLWQSLMDMGRIGALPNGGCNRAALSAADRSGRDQFVAWCRESGCDVLYDQIGNIFARRSGTESGRAAVATGSHLDTQPHGGKFDGIYGVLAGLEVVRSLNDAGVRTRAPLDVIVWTNEEGVRFSPPLAGSSVFAGLADLASVHRAPTLDGTTVLDDLRSTGYLGDERPGSRPLDCFIETHIEQGPILEARGRTIGVVTQIVGIRWSQVAVIGQDGHAGTTPMDRRRDALLGAAEMITTLNRLARECDDSARLTVGRIQVSPNSGATIPGAASFVVDLRHPDAGTLATLEGRLYAAIRNIAASHRLEARIERTIDKPPLPFEPSIVAMVREAAAQLGYSHMDMLSGAGHDAMNIARVVPTGMIFVPCKDGLSHNEAEGATAEDLAAGTHTLLHAMLARAGVA